MNYKFSILVTIITIIILITIIISLLTLKNQRYNKKEQFTNQSIIKNTKDNKITLAIHTVFILKENLPFLREWILYHLHIGFDKIFLYDNTGSVGDKNTSNKDMNKYGFNFNQLVDIDMRQVASQRKGHYSTPGNYIYNELQSILNDFNDNIIYVKWQPIDSDGNIIYGQKQAIEHYITNYTKLSDYTAHIDVDEFIVSKNNTNIKDYIFNQSKDNVTKLIIKQKKMSDRFCDKQPINILDITNSIENIDTTGWAHKLIIKNDATNIENITSINIHSIKTTYGNTINVPIDTIRFNHYNVNKKQIEWMKGYYNKNTIDDFTYGNDTTISQYSSIIKSLCKNKCSNKNNFINMDLVKKEYDNLCSDKWN